MKSHCSLAILLAGLGGCVAAAMNADMINRAVCCLGADCRAVGCPMNTEPLNYGLKVLPGWVRSHEVCNADQIYFSRPLFFLVAAKQRQRI